MKVAKKAAKIYTYDQALELIIPRLQNLKEKKQLKSFCEEHKLQYKTVSLISTKYKKQYPDLLFDLLEIFGYKIERTKAFMIFNISDLN